MIGLDRARLTCADIVAAARHDEPVVLDADARDRAARSHELAVRLSGERAIYGRSTGVGANRSIPVAATNEHALALLRSHAASAGPFRSRERVRAMLVVRLGQLAAGGSGASPALLDALAAMLAAGALPLVREHGSVGTGDLAALATAALALAGEAPVTSPLPSVLTVTPFTFTPHDALPFLSSNAAVIGDAALACADLSMLARSAVVVAGMSFAATGGNAEAFAEVVERVTPFEGARDVCRWMRSLTAGGPGPRRIQDTFGLRTLPQVHGPLLDALAALEGVVTALANAPGENPVVLGDAGQLAHHGGFHAAYLGQALDTAVLAVAQAAQLVLARVGSLVDPVATGLTPFLGDGTPGASGVMMLEYIAAAALGDLRALAAPAGLQSVVLSRGVEEDASFASLAARQALGAVGPLRTLLVCELVAAVRALRMLGLGGLAPAGELLQAAMDTCAPLPGQREDRDLSADVELAEQLLDRLAELLPTG